MNDSHWKQRPEGGSRFAFHLIRFIASNGGRSIARLTLYPIVAYFLIVRGPERRASRAYLARVLDRPPTLLDVARHIHTFAATILDRVYMLSRGMDRFDVDISGLEPIDRQLDRGQGMLLFGSHLGSFEALRVLARQRPDLKVRVVLDRAHNPQLTQLLDAMDPQIARNVIDAGQDGPSIVFAIKQATDEGALVALLVDRAAPGEPSTSASFLGASAQFPTAPWLIAAALKLPVVLGFGLYRGGSHYDLVFETFSEGVAIERHNRPAILAALVQRYAERLQAHARSAPYNWFNFYDFWHADDPQQALPDAGVGADVQRRVAARRSGY
ncbi:Lysophospholipid acyltransferase [Lysobacter capsici AZ78]|uniref:Lysophospholipid acyltransferase n=1 Tax=Lysobacter capsici AZ78 TaxID=1444315 RepID=A0A120AHB8_9GAMM|nr:acyltransferase [Lysobacter capsici]KWS05917.1 Lysophospholipid acyltransferase [Lysobacter capsici AZ78]